MKQTIVKKVALPVKKHQIKRFENRLWGWFFVLQETKKSWVKLLLINANQSLSLQSHKYRQEKWDVMSGSMIVELDGEQSILHQGDTITIPAGSKHRARGLDHQCAWIEYATGVKGPCLEDDIVRYQDDYGRI